MEETEQTAWLHSPRTPECAQIQKRCLPFSAVKFKSGIRTHFFEY